MIATLPTSRHTAAAYPAPDGWQSVALEDQIHLDLGGGRRVSGFGPFVRKKQVPAGQWAFYVNDFMLQHPEPWLVPSRVDFSHGNSLLGVADSVVRPQPLWTQPGQKQFGAIFEHLLGKIKQGALHKAVPAVTERAAWQPEWAEALLARSAAPQGDSGSYGYGYQLPEGGAAGRTPEMLFRLDESGLVTMALAGTVPRGYEKDLLESDKLQREHQTVVSALRERLQDLGTVRVERRGLLTLGSLTHLCTKVRVDLAAEVWERRADELIHLLHPTPALGIAPRTVESMRLLAEYRDQLGIPPHFAAPLGVKWPGGMHILAAIRGLFWQGNDLYLPAGCGVVQGSTLEGEWAELELKRRWIHRAFGV